jgi:putative endopeptidase
VKSIKILSYYIIILLVTFACSSRKESSFTKENSKIEITSDNLIIPKKRSFKVDESVSPCEDLYEHVCRNENSNFVLPVDRSRWTYSFSDSGERINRAKKKYLKDLKKLSVKSKRVRQLKNFYLSCVNLKQREVDELALIEEVRQDLASITTKEKLKAYLGQNILSSDKFSFVDIGKISKLDDPDYNDFYIYTNIMDLDHRKYYKDNKLKDAYTQLVKDFFSLYDKNISPGIGNDFHALEKEFSEINPLPEEWRKLRIQRNMTPQSVIAKRYPHLRLKGTFAQIPNRIVLRNFTPKSYEFVNNMLETKSLDFLKSFIAYKRLASVIDQSNPQYFQQRFDFRHKHFGGPKQRSALEKRCTYEVADHFGKEIDYELIGELFPNFNEKRFLKLLEKVKATVSVELKKNKWLSPESKKGALKKMKHLSFQVVKPKRIKDWDFNYVRNYTVNSYMKNLDIYHTMKIKKLLVEVKKKNNKGQWWMSPLDINAYYSQSQNKFVMPMGILQPPFYDESLPDAANFGSVGVVVAHEIGHGFDDNGAKYDYSGKLKQWMSDKDVATFKKKGARLSSFYEEYKMIGPLTLGENIGDLTGLDFAFKAAFSDKRISSKENKQAFFNQYAKIWCQKIRPKSYERARKLDSHSQVPARVNAPIGHIDGLYEAYSCKKGDKMFVEKGKRVRIW